MSRAMHNPKFKDVQEMWLTMFKKHGEDFDVFIAGYQVQEMYDRNGELIQQLTPYVYIR